MWFNHANNDCGCDQAYAEPRLLQQLNVTLEVPEGYEFTGEYRQPQLGEWFLTSTGHARTAHDNDHAGRVGKRFILRKLWEPASCFPDGSWLYESVSMFNGPHEWYVSDREPTEFGGNHAVEFPGVCVRADRLCKIHGVEFSPPNVAKIQVKHHVPF